MGLAVNNIATAKPPEFPMKKLSKNSRKRAKRANREAVKQDHCQKVKVKHHSERIKPMAKPATKPTRTKERNEYHQVALRLGILSVKGKGNLVGGTSEAEYATASRSNPVQPPVYGKGVNFSPVIHKPRNNGLVGRKTWTFANGTEKSTGDLEKDFNEGRITQEQLLAILAVQREKFRPANAFDPIAHVNGKRGLDKEGNVK